MSTGDLYNEPALLLRIARGDQSSFKTLVDRYWQKVYGHALAYAKSMPVAKELTQDVFMDIWNFRDKLGTIEDFPNYLFIVTRNRVFKALRKKLEETLATEGISLQEDVWLPDRQIEYREVYAIVLKGIQQLPPVRRKVFTMSRLDGMSYEQICRELNLSRNTVKEHIVKALNSLRIYLARHGNPLAPFIIIGILTFLLFYF